MRVNVVPVRRDRGAMSMTVLDWIDLVMCLAFALLGILAGVAVWLSARGVK
jgi:hypothetical protein